MNKWIKTSERLPENQQEVLIIYEGKAAISVYFGKFATNFHWIDGAEFDADWISSNQITCWQPLPELPQKDK